MGNNGIEYAELQLICDKPIHLLRSLLGLRARSKLVNKFEKMEQGVSQQLPCLKISSPIIFNKHMTNKTRRTFS